MSFADRLILLRQQKRLTQIELAKLVNVSRSALSLYELGKREPDFITLSRIAAFFNVTTDYLLGRTDTSNASPHPITLENEPSQQDLEEFLRTSNVQFDGAPLDSNDKEEIIDVLKFVWKKFRKDKEDKNSKPGGEK